MYKQYDKFKGVAATLVFASLAFLMPSTSWAFFGTGLEMRVGTVYCDIFQALQGTTAQGIATLAVVFLGLGAMYGKADKAIATIVIVGIAIIFGSVAIVDFIGGSAVPFFNFFVGTEDSCAAAKVGEVVTDAGTVAGSMLEVFIGNAGTP